MTVELFQTLWQVAKQANGDIILPSNIFLRWRPNTKGEILTITSSDLQIKQLNYNPEVCCPFTHDEELKQEEIAKAKLEEKEFEGKKIKYLVPLDEQGRGEGELVEDNGIIFRGAFENNKKHGYGV